MSDRNSDRKFQTLEGLTDLKFELSPKTFGQRPEAPEVTYTVGARQLYVLAELAGFAIDLQRADDYNETPARKARLHAALRECLDRFWETPLDPKAIRENW